MSKIITVTEGKLPRGVKINQVKTIDEKGEFAKGSNKTITMIRNIKSTDYPIKALVAGDNINITQSRSLFLKFEAYGLGSFYSYDNMDGIGKIQSITIIPIEPRQVAIEIGDTYYIFNYDGDSLHGVRTSLGSNELLGRHGYYKSFFCYPDSWRKYSHLALGRFFSR